MRVIKSSWETLGFSEADIPAIRTMFCGMIDECEIVEFEHLENFETGMSKKVRALVRRQNGNLREMIRTFGPRFSITSKSPTADMIRRAEAAGVTVRRVE